MVLKVIEPLWPTKREVEPWCAGYALPWGAWLREWPDFYWRMPRQQPRDMKWEPDAWPLMGY